MNVHTEHVLAAVAQRHQSWITHAIAILAAFDDAPSDEWPGLLEEMNANWHPDRTGQPIRLGKVDHERYALAVKSETEPVAAFHRSLRRENPPLAVALGRVREGFLDVPASVMRTARFAALLDEGMFPYVQIPADILEAVAAAEQISEAEVREHQDAPCQIVQAVLMYPDLSPIQLIAALLRLVTREKTDVARIAALTEVIAHAAAPADGPRITMIRLEGSP